MKKRKLLNVTNLQPSPLADLLDDIKLNQDELNELQEIDREAIKIKVTLADLVQQEASVKEAISKNLTTLTDKQKVYIDVVRRLATEHGIDVDNPDKGRWNFNSETGTFNKLS